MRHIRDAQRSLVATICRISKILMCRGAKVHLFMDKVERCVNTDVRKCD